MNENLGKILDDAGLTLEEEIYYADYAEIDICDLCGNYIPIINWNDGENHLTFCGGKLYCQKCNK